jgi:hypothetical protein
MIIGLFGLLAATWHRCWFEKDLDHEFDPLSYRIEDRLSRIEALLEGMQPTPNGERGHTPTDESADHARD